MAYYNSVKRTPAKKNMYFMWNCIMWFLKETKATDIINYFLTNIIDNVVYYARVKDTRKGTFMN